MVQSSFWLILFQVLGFAPRLQDGGVDGVLGHKLTEKGPQSLKNNGKMSYSTRITVGQEEQTSLKEGISIKICTEKRTTSPFHIFPFHTYTFEEQKIEVYYCISLCMCRDWQIEKIFLSYKTDKDERLETRGSPWWTILIWITDFDSLGVLPQGTTQPPRQPCEKTEKVAICLYYLCTSEISQHSGCVPMFPVALSQEWLPRLFTRKAGSCESFRIKVNLA